MNRHRFDLVDLQAFTAISRLGSFRAAAQAIHLSQPALSRRVDKLEAALGVRLLERSTRRVSLTAVGREFARKAQGWLDEIDATLLGVAELAQQRTGLVTLACVPSAARFFLPAVLQRFHAEMPRIRVHSHDGHANEVLLAVTSGVADFGLNFDGQQEGGLLFRPLLRDRFVLACRRDHPLAQRRNVRWSELAGERVLASGSASGNRLLLERALSEQGQGLHPVAEARHVQTVLGLVEAGLGVAPVPRLALHESLGALVGVPLVQPSVHRMIGLIRRQGVQLGPAAKALHDFILEKHPKQLAGTRR